MTTLKLILMTLVALATIIVVYLTVLSYLHRQSPARTAADSRLAPCPQKPNCVSSLAQAGRHHIEGFDWLDSGPEPSWARLVGAIERNGGEVQFNDGRYCHAVFSSTLFRFRDDLEISMGEHGIEVRSASRAGTSDLGANRRRVEGIRRDYLAGETGPG